MNLNSSLHICTDEYIRAAPDPQLSSSQSNLLATLLKEEDQYQYYQIINTPISIDIQHLLHQVRSCLLNCLHHYIILLLVMFTSSSFIFCHMDVNYFTQKTYHSKTFTRFLHYCCLCHTLVQISRFIIIITIYRL
jgi:hypothetical protein